jgi:hypothetical protein
VLIKLIIDIIARVWTLSGILYPEEQNSKYRKKAKKVVWYIQDMKW